MSWRKHQAEGRRLAILQLLAEAGYEVNDQVLAAALEEYGYRTTRDELLGDLAWLAEQQLIADRDLSGVVVVARLTQRGLDVAEGKARAPGVKRPRPEL